MSDSSQNIKRMSLSPQILKNFNRGAEIYHNLHSKSRRLLDQVIRGEIRAGICADFDNTLVPTDEAARVFYTLDEDPSGTKSPLCGLAMATNMPIGVISGNTIEYITSRCTEPLQDFILASPFREKIINVAIYALNGGYAMVFDKSGAEDHKYIERYHRSKKMSPQISETISKIMMEEVNKIVPETVAGGYKPIEVRAGKTTIYTYAPMFQNRADVQKCIVGVYHETREDLLSRIQERALEAKILDKISIQLGGQHSIDCQMKTLDKKVAGREFMEKYKLPCLLYFGDAVYIKPDGTEGNDYAMIHNDNTYVFALNKNKSDTPQDKRGRVQWVGSSPESLRDFLTWFLIEKTGWLITKNPPETKNIKKIFKYLGWI